MASSSRKDVTDKAITSFYHTVATSRMSTSQKGAAAWTPGGKKRKMGITTRRKGANVQSNDSSDVEILAEPPQHMRKVTNVDKPISVHDSDSEEEDRRHLPGPSSPRNKRPSTPPPIRSILKPPSIESERPNKRPKRFLDLRRPIIRYDNRIDSEDIVPSDNSASSTPFDSDVPSSNDSGAEASLEQQWALRPNAGPSIRRPEPVTADTSSSPTTDDHLPRVLEVLPDIDPVWAVKKLAGWISQKSRDPVARVVDSAMDMPEGYPKVQARTVVPKPAEEKGYEDAGYRRVWRMGSEYLSQSMIALAAHFPRVPLPHIRTTFFASHSLYYLTYMALVAQIPNAPDTYQDLKRARPSTANGKGKGRSTATYPVDHLPQGSQEDGPTAYDGGLTEWRKECAYLEARLITNAANLNEEEARRLAREQAFDAGQGVECGCCFGDELPDEMYQCAEGHLFCKECATRHAEVKLGEQITSITCMDTSGCAAPFTEQELSRMLPSKTIRLYHRLIQAEDLAAAGLQGLEACPACPYAEVIENKDEKLFVCRYEECLQVSCRKCRKKEHIPKSCEEAERDRKLDKRHAIEDAMSEALIRKCPKCAKPYLKDSGCNKIMCIKCATVSCYVCQTAINGYDHFDQTPPEYTGPRVIGKCRLWDREEVTRDEANVLAARDAARARIVLQAAEEGLEMAEDDLKVDAPRSVPLPNHYPVPGRQPRRVLAPPAAAGRWPHGLPDPRVQAADIAPNNRVILPLPNLAPPVHFNRLARHPWLVLPEVPADHDDNIMMIMDGLRQWHEPNQEAR